MGSDSKIEWTTHTWNPWFGCTEVGPPCDRCYARVMMAERYGRVRWGAGEDRVRTAPSTWAQPLRWDRIAQADGSRPTVFCLSLGDIWDNEVDPLWRRDAFAVMERTPHLTYLLLSKRIGNAVKMCDPMAGNPCLPRNAALGATFGDQEEYDRDRMKLKHAGEVLGALFTFASIEPMLGPVILDCNAPDWIICGGESGRSPREMDPQWARDLRDGAARFKRAFFMKQMTAKAPIPDDLMVRQFPAPSTERSKTTERRPWGLPAAPLIRPVVLTRIERRRTLMKPTVDRLDWRTLFKPKNDLPPETIKVFDDYFACFAQPPMKVDADGKNNIGGQPCLKCGEPLAGGLADFLLSKGGFTWGIVHGEGFCAGCKWPARAYHFIKDGEGNDLITIRNVILQYHPDFVEERKRGKSAA